jgi:hypothetical protein
MSTMQQPTPNHQSETFGSGQTQFFECEALSADRPEIQAREPATQLRLQLPNPTEKQARRCMIRLRRVQFPVAGVYEAMLTLDGQNIATISHPSDCLPLRGQDLYP